MPAIPPRYETRTRALDRRQHRSADPELDRLVGHNTTGGKVSSLAPSYGYQRRDQHFQSALRGSGTARPCGPEAASPGLQRISQDPSACLLWIQAAMACRRHDMFPGFNTSLLSVWSRSHWVRSQGSASRRSVWPSVPKCALPTLRSRFLASSRCRGAARVAHAPPPGDGSRSAKLTKSERRPVERVRQPGTAWTLWWKVSTTTMRLR